MNACLKSLLLTLLSALSLIASAQVKGYAHLDIPNTTDHSDIMVIFFDEYTFDAIDTAFTNEKGYFETNLKPGGYFVFYEKSGFDLIRVPDSFEAKEITELESQKLKPRLPIGPGKTNKMWNPYAEKCVCTIPAHHLSAGSGNE